MNRNDFKGVYDKRVIGLYENNIVYYDKKQGYVIQGLYPREPSKVELIGIKKRFEDLENKIDGGIKW